MAARKTLKSCQSCRSAKAKCIPSPDPETKQCQRCIKYNKDCVYVESRPRPKRGKQTHTRVAEVEKKLDDIRTLVESEQYVKPSLKKDAVNGVVEHPTLSTVTSQIHELPETVSASELSHSSIVKQELPHQHAHRDRDAIDKEILSEKEASDLLLFYRASKQDFPFIYVDPKATLDTLRWEKPFLLLAILAISSQRTRSLQILLEKELREVLASKLIIEGELSYDVLQGVLFYLSWYHYNFRPCRQQVYLLTQLCGSMAIDLGIHKPSVENPRFLVHPSKTCMATKQNTAKPAANERESMRTYIGVYCLTTSLSIMLRKPNGMSWSPYLERCCSELAKEPETSMDSYLTYYVRLLHVCEDISSTFGYCSPEPDVPSNYQRLQSTVRAFIANIKDIAKSFPLEMQNTPSLISLFHTSQTLAYEVILHVDVQESTTSQTSTNSRNLWHTSPIRTSLVLSCLESLRSSLDWFSALPITDFERLNLLDTSRISYHLLILGRLTISGTPGADENEIISQTLQINAYFDAFVQKFQQLALLHGQDERKSIYWQFHRSFLSSRDWISNRIAERMSGADVANVVCVPVDEGQTGGHSHGHDHHHHQIGHGARTQYALDVEDSWEAAMATLPFMGMEGSVL